MANCGTKLIEAVVLHQELAARVRAAEAVAGMYQQQQEALTHAQAQLLEHLQELMARCVLLYYT